MRLLSPDSLSTGVNPKSATTAFECLKRADLSRLFGDFHRYVADDRQAAFWERYERPWSYLEGAIGEAGGVLDRDLNREPRLPDPTRAGDRNQT